jgi:CBS domain-containing protein
MQDRPDIESIETNPPESPIVSKTISDCMTKVPITIPDDLTLADARQRMFDHKIRHLPVMKGDHLVGIVSERDIAMISSIPGVKSDRVLINQAMTDGPFTCAPGDALESVATTMLERKIGAAIVMEESTVVGMFTTIDALRELVERLD